MKNGRCHRRSFLARVDGTGAPHHGGRYSTGQTCRGFTEPAEPQTHTSIVLPLIQRRTPLDATWQVRPLQIQEGREAHAALRVPNPNR